MTVAVTIGGKVDTAETGDGGDFKLFTVAPFDKSIHRFLTLSSVGTLNKLTAPLPCTLSHPGKMQERCGGDVTV